MLTYLHIRPTLTVVLKDGVKIATYSARNGIWELRDFATSKPMAHENTRKAIHGATQMIYGKKAT